MTELNWVDYLIIGIFALSMLAGLMRGLLKEVIALITWVAACVVSSMFAAKLAGSFGPAGQSSSLLAIAASYVTLFVATLLVGGIVNFTVSKVVEAQGISFANRFLGALFGGMRGFLIVVIMMFLAQLTPLGNQAIWQQSPFVNTLQPAVQWLSDTVQPGLETIKSKVGNAVQDINSQIQSGSSAVSASLPSMSGVVSTLQNAVK